MPSSDNLSISPNCVPPTRSKSKVTPQHTLERVRNNQRRHRARRLDHITTLEGKLKESQSEIALLRQQIVSLRKDLGRCRCQKSLATQNDHAPASEPLNGEPYQTAGIETSNFLSDFETSLNLGRFKPDSYPDSYESTTSVVFDVASADTISGSEAGFTEKLFEPAEFGSMLMHPSTVQQFPSNVPSGLLSSCSFQLLPISDAKLLTAPSSLPTTSQMTSPPPQWPTNEITSTSSLVSPYPSVLQSTYAPCIPKQSCPTSNSSRYNSSESTVLCKQAYQLISTQNYKGLSQGEIVSWLSSGFRWPNKSKCFWGEAEESWGDGKEKEDGCRVETTLLFGLLTFISEF